MRERAESERGFTLVEVLVSLALLVLLFALLPNAVGLGRRAWETHEDASAAIERKARLAVLEQRLAEAQPQFEAAGGGGLAIAFVGEPDALEFVATGTGQRAIGLWRWRVASSGTQQIEVSAQPFPVSFGDPATVRPLFAERGVSLRLAYFGRATPNTEAAWHERWPRTDALPQLVEIVLSPMRGGSGTRRLVVAPQLAPQ